MATKKKNAAKRKRSRTFGKGKLGSGSRFATCVSRMSKRPDIDDPEAVCAAIGRSKYGKARFQRMALQGRNPMLPMPKRGYVLEIGMQLYPDIDDDALMMKGYPVFVGPGYPAVILAEGKPKDRVLIQVNLGGTPRFGWVSKKNALKYVGQKEAVLRGMEMRGDILRGKNPKTASGPVTQELYDQIKAEGASEVFGPHPYEQAQVQIGETGIGDVIVWVRAGGPVLVATDAQMDRARIKLGADEASRRRPFGLRNPSPQGTSLASTEGATALQLVAGRQPDTLVAESYSFSKNLQRGDYSASVTASDIQGPFQITITGPDIEPEHQQFQTSEAAEFYAHHRLDELVPVAETLVHEGEPVLSPLGEIENPSLMQPKQYAVYEETEVTRSSYPWLQKYIVSTYVPAGVRSEDLVPVSIHKTRSAAVRERDRRNREFNKGRVGETSMNPSGFQVEDYNLKAKTGRHIRKATQVIFPDGYRMEFMEKMPKRAAIKQAIEERRKEGRRFLAEALGRSSPKLWHENPTEDQALIQTRYAGMVPLADWNRIWGRVGGLWQMPFSEGPWKAYEKALSMGKNYYFVRVPEMGFGIIHEGDLRNHLGIEVRSRNPLIEPILGGAAAGTAVALANKAIKNPGWPIPESDQQPLYWKYLAEMAGEYWASGLDDESGVANARIVSYGLSRWMREWPPRLRKPRRVTKAKLLKWFGGGYREAKKMGEARNPDSYPNPRGVVDTTEKLVSTIGGEKLYLVKSDATVIGFISKRPDTRDETHPWKAFAPSWKPGVGAIVGEMLGAFYKRDGGKQAAIGALRSHHYPSLMNPIIEPILGGAAAGAAVALTNKAINNPSRLELADMAGRNYAGSPSASVPGHRPSQKAIDQNLGMLVYEFDRMTPGAQRELRQAFLRGMREELRRGNPIPGGAPFYQTPETGEWDIIHSKTGERMGRRFETKEQAERFLRGIKESHPSVRHYWRIVRRKNTPPSKGPSGPKAHGRRNPASGWPIPDDLDDNPQHWYYEAAEAGDYWASGPAYESGVADARVVAYGFRKWLNEWSPATKPPRGVTQAKLKKWFGQGYRLGLRRQNPASYPDSEQAAADFFEKFHGRPSEEMVIVPEDEHYHEYLGGIGELVEIKLKTKSGYKLDLDFAGDNVMVAASEDGQQLYLVGGDQKIDLGSIHMDAAKWRKDLMDLGEIQELTYRTDKSFDDHRTTDYYHKLSEYSNGPRPSLLYDTLNDRLKLAGGVYRIPLPPMGTSPGIVD